MPPDVPETLVKEVVMRCFVNADHAVEKVTRISSSGFIIFLKMAPIYYFSKRQNIVNKSTLGSDVYGYEACVHIYSWPLI